MSYLNKISDDEFRKIVKENCFFISIYSKCGYSKNPGGPVKKNIKERIKNLNIDTTHFKGPTNSESYLGKISDDEFRKIVKESYYFNDIMKKIGYKPLLNKKQRDKIKNRIKNLNIDISHFKYSFPKELKEYLIKDGQPCINHIKKRLYEEKILEEKCVGCSIGNIYNNKPITLQLDHINGINTDNRIENLRILCPNCHSQTATWGTRNIKYQAKNNVL